MTFPQYVARNVQHTVKNAIEDKLEDLGWMGDSVPFGAKPVRMVTSPVLRGDQLVPNTIGGTVAVTLGTEFAPDMEEMGGPLASQAYPIFIDVLQDEYATALNLATDIRDILLGRLPGTKRWIDLIDQSDQSTIAGWQLELDDVERSTPPTSLPLHWQVVKVTAIAHFLEESY
jgi:hypothetical protein